MALGLSLALGKDEFNGTLEGDAHGVFALAERGVFFIVEHVGAETACVDHHWSVFEGAEGAGEFEELEGFFERDARQAELRRQCGKRGLFLIAGHSHLHHRTEAADFHRHNAARHGVDAQFALSHLVFGLLVEGFLHLGFEIFVEVANEFGPVFLSVGHGVEVFLNVGREIIVHDFWEILRQEVIDHDADIGRDEFALLRTGFFCIDLLGDFARVALEFQDAIFSRRAFFLSLRHILALLDGGDGGGVGGRTADAEFFHFVHQGGFGVTRGLLRETLAGRDFLRCERFSFLHWREDGGVFFEVAIVFLALAIDFEEAFKLDDFSVGHEAFVA